jgi:hypothetical protein
MRFLVGLFIVLASMAWLARQWPSDPASQSGVAASPWRHTVGGWEKLDLEPAANSHEPALHPALVGSMQVMLVMLALLSLPNKNTGQPVIVTTKPRPFRYRNRRAAW